MKQKTFSLIGALMMTGLVAFPSQAGIILRASKTPTAQPIQVVSYLSETNEALQKALRIHNVMNEIPEFRDVEKNTKYLEEQKDFVQETLKNMNSCNSKKLEKVFKNPQEAWAGIMHAYDQRRQISQKETQNRDSLTLSLKDRMDIENASWMESREVLMDVYQNPENWGAVNKDASFPLWKDQISLFEKEWNEFYEKLNASYGVELKGRPSIDEETRHNPKKYAEVLAAHKMYLKGISNGRRPADSEIASANPPKAPQPLPDWKAIVRIDPLTGKASPTLPEPWQKMADNKFKNYSEKGEMAEFFEGKSLTPTKTALSGGKSNLELEYDMSLAMDALNKGTSSIATTRQKQKQKLVDKLKGVGLDLREDEVANGIQYQDVMKRLKELKKKALKEAYSYVEKLEEQDKNNPDYVAKREEMQAQRRARLSASAQEATSGMSDVIQTGQLSPTVRQRLVLAALEKDENATVHLTETNAVNIDQLMRERKSTNKLIAESHQQLGASLEKAKEGLPQMARCQF